MTGRIFINYRRGDESGSTGRLFDRLEQAFTADRLFMDVDHIGPGLDFVRVLEDEVSKCDVLLAVIGKNWLDARDDNGARRLESPNDFVRIEIESALKLGKRIIPVLINDAQMPRADDLPKDMKLLSRRNAVRLTHERFKSEVQGLVKILEMALAEIEEARALASEEERKAAEQAIRRRQEEEAARAAEAESQARERAREQAAQGLSPVEILKAEELANWDFIKSANDATELRNHLARFPGSVTERYARAALEEIVWKGLGQAADLSQLEAFVSEFPTGRFTADARLRIDERRRDYEAKQRDAALSIRETNAWARASAADNLAAYQEFIAEWPSSARKKVAQRRLSELQSGERPPPPELWLIGLVSALFTVAISLAIYVVRNISTIDIPLSGGAFERDLMLAVSSIVILVGAWAIAKRNLSTSSVENRPPPALYALGIVAFAAVVWAMAGYSLSFTSSNFAHPSVIGGLSKLFLTGVTADSQFATYSNGVYVSEWFAIFYWVAVACFGAALLSCLAPDMGPVRFLIFIALWLPLVLAPSIHMALFWGGPDAYGNAAKAVAEATGEQKATAQTAMDAVLNDVGILWSRGLVDLAGGLYLALATGVSGIVASSVLGGSDRRASAPMLRPDDRASWMMAVVLGLSLCALVAGANLEVTGFNVICIIAIILASGAGLAAWLHLERLMSGTWRGESVISGLLAAGAAALSVCGFGSVLATSIIAVAASLLACLVALSARRASRAFPTIEPFVVLAIGGAVGGLATGIAANPDFGGFGILDYISNPGQATAGTYDLVFQTTAQGQSALVIAVWSGFVTAIIAGVMRLTQHR